MSRTCLVALSLVLLPSTADAAEDALSSILTKDRYSELCVKTADGRQLVDPGNMAYALISQAGVPFNYRDRANPEGRPDNAATLDEDIYLLTHPDAVLDTSDISKRVIRDVGDSRSSLRHYLKGMSPVGDPNIYRVQKIVEIANPDLDDYFAKPARVVIACSSPVEAEESAALLDFRLRGKVEDLRDRAVDAKTLKRTSAATVSFESNDVSDTQTYDVNLATGVYFDLSPKVGQYSLGLLPFVQYERRETTGDTDRTGDKDKLGVGLLGDLFVFGKVATTPTFRVGFYPKYVADFELNTEVASATAFATPNFFFPLPGDGAFQTNIFNPVGPVLLIKPGIKFVTTANYVLDEGQNPDLADHDDFYGLGGEAALAFAFEEGTPVLSDISITFSYRWLSLFSTSKDDLDRFEAALAYDLLGNGNAILELSYVDGDDMDTQQEENLWRVALGLKF